MEQKTKLKNTKGLLLIVGALLLAIVSAALLIGGTTLRKDNPKTWEETLAEFESSHQEIEAEKEVGQKAEVSGAILSKISTGTAPFDNDDNTGNDKSEDNDIVRTLDKVIWLIEADMNLKDKATGTETDSPEKLKGGC